MREEIEKSAVAALLESHEFTIQCAESSRLIHVDFTEEHKAWLAAFILRVLKEKNLELDFSVPRVRLVIFKAGPSEITYGPPSIDLDGTVFIFTDMGPKHFTWRFGIYTGNSRFVQEIDREVDAITDPGVKDSVEPVDNLQPNILQDLIARVRKLLKLPNNRA